jgi:hypothetical protein
MKDMKKLIYNNGQELIRPICPNCGKVMGLFSFVGYYEEFNYWDCNCDLDSIKDTDGEIAGKCI